MGAGGARIALHTELFPSLLSAEEAFSGFVDDLVQETFSGGKPPDPQIIVVLEGDQCIKLYSSGQEFRDQNLALWTSICIDLPSLETLPPCPRYGLASLHTNTEHGHRHGQTGITTHTQTDTNYLH